MTKNRVFLIVGLLISMLLISGNVLAVEDFGFYAPADLDDEVGIYADVPFIALMMVDDEFVAFYPEAGFEVGEMLVGMRPVVGVHEYVNDDLQMIAEVMPLVQFCFLNSDEKEVNTFLTLERGGGEAYRLYETQAYATGDAFGNNGVTNYSGYQRHVNNETDYFYGISEQEQIDRPRGIFLGNGCGENERGHWFTTPFPEVATSVQYVITAPNGVQDGRVLYQRIFDEVEINLGEFLQQWSPLGAGMISTNCAADGTRMYFGNLTHQYIDTDTNTTDAVTAFQFVEMQQNGFFRTVGNTALLASASNGADGTSVPACPVGG